MSTSTSSFSRRLCLFAVTMAFITGIIIGILLPVYVPTSSSSSLPIVPFHDQLVSSNVHSSGNSKLNHGHYDRLTSSEQWNHNAVGGSGDVLLTDETRRQQRWGGGLLLQRYDDVRLSGSLNDPNYLQGGTPHGALSWPVLDTSPTTPPPSTTTSTLSLQQQQQKQLYHHLTRPKSNQDTGLEDEVHGQDRLTNPLQELTSGTAPSEINHTSLNAKFRQQLEAKIINRRLKNPGMATSSLSSSSSSSSSATRPDLQQHQPPPSRWSQFSKGRLKLVEKMNWNDLLFHSQEETSVKQLVAKTPNFLQESSSSSNRSSNNSNSADLVTIEHSNADSLGDIPSEIQLSLPTTTRSTTATSQPTRLTTSLLLPRLLAVRRRWNFTLPKGKRLGLQRGVTTQPNSADLVTIGLPQITRPIPLLTQVKLQVGNNRVQQTIYSGLDFDDKPFLDLTLSSSSSDKTSSKEVQPVINNPDEDGSTSKNNNNGSRNNSPSEDRKISSSWSDSPSSTSSTTVLTSKEESFTRPLFQPWHVSVGVEQLPLEEKEKPLNFSTVLQFDTDGKFIDSINSLISDGVYWSASLESLLPRGFSVSDVREWVDYARNTTVVRVLEGCGRMQNRLLVFDDGTQSCCRYRQNNDQIQGDIFSFYLAQLLGMQNLPPATLGLLQGHERQWLSVRSQLTLAQWNEQKPIVMTKFVDNLVPAYIPKHFRGDGPEERRRLHPIPEDVLGLTNEELRELVQFSDLVIFDYLTANLDRVVNNMYNKQWNPDMMTAPAHNLAKVSKTGLLVFLDNESGLLHGYRLLDKYETYHKAMLDGLCVFRRSTADAIKELHRKNDVGFRLKMALLESQPHMTEWLPLLPDKSVKILQERLARVVRQIIQCEDQYVQNQMDVENLTNTSSQTFESRDDYDDSLSNPLKP